MKKFLLIALLFWGCSTEPEEELGLCVKRKNTVIGLKILRQYKCYENLYTKKECYELEGDGWQVVYYTNWETCDKFCDSTEDEESELIPTVTCNSY